MWKVAPVLSWPGAGWSAPTGTVPVPGCQGTGTQPASAGVSGGGSQRDVGWAHGPDAVSVMAQGLQSALLWSEGSMTLAWARNAQSRAPLDQLCTC